MFSLSAVRTSSSRNAIRIVFPRQAVGPFCARIATAAYYSKLLLLAKEQKRIDSVPLDPLMQVRAYFDIGGTGARANAVSIWISLSGRKSTSYGPSAMDAG